jgi:hypothetical protein
VLCAGDQTRGAVWADLDFFAPLFASRQKVEKVKQEGIFQLNGAPDNLSFTLYKLVLQPAYMCITKEHPMLAKKEKRR